LFWRAQRTKQKKMSRQFENFSFPTSTPNMKEELERLATHLFFMQHDEDLTISELWTNVTKDKLTIYITYSPNKGKVLTRRKIVGFLHEVTDLA
jgi:hypothetical protein